MNAVDIVALQELGAQAIANAELASTQHLQLLERIQQLSHLSGHKVGLVKDVAKGMDRSAPVSTLVPQEMARVLAGGAPEERALVHRISHAQAQQDAHQVRVSVVAFTLLCCQYEGVQCSPGNGRHLMSVIFVISLGRASA